MIKHYCDCCGDEISGEIIHIPTELDVGPKEVIDIKDGRRNQTIAIMDLAMPKIQHCCKPCWEYLINTDWCKWLTQSIQSTLAKHQPTDVTPMVWPLYPNKIKL